jgi:hypothetical protein
MLERVLDIDEIKIRFQDAEKKIASFKAKLKEEIENYESQWYYGWYLKDQDDENPNDNHPRVQNVIDLKKLIDDSSLAAPLAKNLLEYIDGSNNHFSWAWFSPLKDYVRDAVNEFPSIYLDSIDNDLKLFTSDKTKTTNLSIHPIQDELAQTNDKLQVAQCTILELQQMVEIQRQTIKLNKGIIESLHRVIDQLIKNFALFKKNADDAVMSFGNMMLDAALYITDVTQNDLPFTQQDEVEAISTEETPTMWIDLNTQNTAGEILDDYYAASQNALQFTDGSPNEILSSLQVSPEYLLFQELQAQELENAQRLASQLDALSDENVQLQAELVLVRQELAEAKKNPVQQGGLMAAEHNNDSQQSAPPPPPPPGPPPPLAKPPARIIVKKTVPSEVNSSDNEPQQLPLGAKTRGTLFAGSANETQAGLLDELAKAAARRSAKAEVKMTPPKKQFLTSQEDLFSTLRKKFENTLRSPAKLRTKKTVNPDAANTSLDKTF